MFRHQDLKARQRAVRDSFPSSLSLRIHRALSWLRRAEQESADDDARFLFLWISFNAAYANEIHDRRALTERKLLLHNPYVFQPFWDYQGGKIQEDTWKKAFERSKASANRGQMKDGANILGYLVPVVIHLMMENHHQLWGDACFPVVE